MNQSKKFNQSLEYLEWLSETKKNIIWWSVILSVLWWLATIPYLKYWHPTAEDKKIETCLAQIDESRELALQCLADGFNARFLNPERMSHSHDFNVYQGTWFWGTARELAWDEAIYWSYSYGNSYHMEQWETFEYWRTAVPVTVTYGPGNIEPMPTEKVAEILQNYKWMSDVNPVLLEISTLAERFMLLCNSRTHQWKRKDEIVDERDQITKNNPDLFPYEDIDIDWEKYDHIGHYFPRNIQSNFYCSNYASQIDGARLPRTETIELQKNSFAYEVYDEALNRYYPGWEPSDKLLVWNRALELLRWKYQSSIEKWEWLINNKSEWDIRVAWEYIVTEYFIKK